MSDLTGVMQFASDLTFTFNLSTYAGTLITPYRSLEAFSFFTVKLSHEIIEYTRIRVVLCMKYAKKTIFICFRFNE